MVVHSLLLLWLDGRMLREVSSSDKGVDMTKVNTVNFHTRESAVTRVNPGYQAFPKLTSREQI
jgi:hypothetical protein